MRHPREMGEAEINAFLSHLATEERVSASTQNQALAALLFLYRTVLGGDVGNLEGVIRARTRPRLPVVLTVDEVRAVLGHLGGAEALVAQLLDGAGSRHPHDSGAAGSQRCEDHHDLHPCAESRSIRRPEFRRLALKSGMLCGPCNKPCRASGGAVVLLGVASWFLGGDTISILCGKKAPGGSLC